jgi:hypothetical protein
MTADDRHSPRLVHGIAISSSFADLKDHRVALIKAIRAHGLTDVAMENDSAKLMDVIDSSLQMVRDGSAYIGVISKKYGQIPRSPEQNPDDLSVNELEFNEALRLGRPILLFVMGKSHYVLEGHIETNAAKRQKLDKFREQAKRMTADSLVHRAYATFDSLEEFKEKVGPSIAELLSHLEAGSERLVRTVDEKPASTDHIPIPKPPAFYAEPAFIGSHRFIGRQAQLEVLSDWAQSADPHSILLFEAIGGNGKSMLTWEWTTQHANGVRADWAGRFWYSFYDKGAVMADYCRRALAYVTGQPLEQFHKKRTPELAEQLLRHLQARPWLFILDGLERVLIAYHRIDAAEVPDEDANRPTDKILARDPCAAIRPEDDDLLRALASVAPSKVLISSRLVPRVLLNAAGQPIPGVQRIYLPGLRPADAEALLRSCGVTGDSRAIQEYLTKNCDCHPLVIGVLAGLINEYLPDKGDFDAWADDPSGGGQLNLASLDLIHRRNHILGAGLDALSEKSRRLLSTLALLSEAVDYPTLCAFNPHLPPEPEEVEEPENPEHRPSWEHMSDAEKAKKQQDYQGTLERRKEYELKLEARLQSHEFLVAPKELARTVRDLERRGLLQYDGRVKRYDLHPVVRGIASGGLRADERDRYSQLVVDYFSRRTHLPYDEAETLEDLRDGLHVVRTLLNMGRFEQAYQAYQGDLANALLFNLEAYGEVLSLLRPFFARGWDTLPSGVDQQAGSYLAAIAAIALERSDEPIEALAAYGAALLADLEMNNWGAVAARLRSISTTLIGQNRLGKAHRVNLLSFDFAGLLDDEGLFLSRLWRFDDLSRTGQWTEAETIWRLLNPMGRDWSRASYRPGDAECSYAWFRFWRGDLQAEDLAVAERLATAGKNRMAVRDLHGLRGAWQIEQGQWALAAESLHEAARMARGVGTLDAIYESRLALARFHLGQLPDPRREAEQLAQDRSPAHQALAELWLAIGDREQATKHALAAYKSAWADGEPHVYRYELNRATSLLAELGAAIPKLPPYDASNDNRFEWENVLIAALKDLRYRTNGAVKAADLAEQWVDFLKGERPRSKLPLLAPGFPVLRIVRCRLRNIASFVDTGFLDFNSNAALLLGNNATGKSTLLRCLALASIGSDAANEVVEGSAPSYLRRGAERGAIEVLFDLIPTADSTIADCRRFSVGLSIEPNSGRFAPLPNSEMTITSDERRINCIEQLNVLRKEINLSFGFTSAYGSTRNFSDSRYAIEPENTKSENEWVISLFRPQAWLTSPEVLIKLIRGDTRNIRDAPEILDTKVIESIKAGLDGLLPNVELAPMNCPSDVRILGTELPLQDLSDGYRSMLAFAGHMVRSALRLTGWTTSPFAVQGIALVDEIESHLHPAWQKHILKDLCQLFPNIQWIWSTHSALVAGSITQNAIILLEQADGEVAAHQIGQSFQGWRADQILTSFLFGLDTSQDEETANRLRKYRTLALRPNLSPDEEIEMRELGETLSILIPGREERQEAREATRLFEDALDDLASKKPADYFRRIQDELLIKIQNSIVTSKDVIK